MNVEAALLEDVADKGGGRRFPVRARNADDLRAATFRQRLNCPREQLHIANDRHIRHLRKAHETVWLGVCQRYSWREDERREVLPVALVEVGDRYPFRFGLGPRCLIVVPGMNLCLTGFQSARSRKASPAKAVHRNVSSSIFGNRDHKGAGYLSFSVARPARANRTERIQKRTTTLVSGQFSFWKW